jgi:hypothetical protein
LVVYKEKVVGNEWPTYSDEELDEKLINVIKIVDPSLLL